MSSTGSKNKRRTNITKSTPYVHDNWIPEMLHSEADISTNKLPVRYRCNQPPWEKRTISSLTLRPMIYFGRHLVQRITQSPLSRSILILTIQFMEWFQWKKIIPHIYRTRWSETKKKHALKALELQAYSLMVNPVTQPKYLGCSTATIFGGWTIIMTVQTRSKTILNYDHIPSRWWMNNKDNK